MILDDEDSANILLFIQKETIPNQLLEMNEYQAQTRMEVQLFNEHLKNLKKKGLN